MYEIIRFPRLAEDINNVLITYYNRILLESIKGIVMEFKMENYIIQMVLV